MISWNKPELPPAPPPAAESAPPARRFTDAERPSTTLGPRLTVRGSLSGMGAVVVSGSFEGPIDIDGLCYIAEGARVTGPVTASDAVIEGELHGRLIVRGRVELRATAKVRADVTARTVAVADGCFFDGRIHMTGCDAPGQPTSFRERRRRRGAAEPPATPPAVAPAPPDVAPADPAAAAGPPRPAGQPEQAG